MKIQSVKSLGIQDVYDVVSSDTRNFMLTNGAIVHNSAIIDEANFLEVTEESKKSDVELYDAGEEIYNAVWHRMVSRFMKNGVVPGIVVLISSPRYPDSLLEKKIAEAKAVGVEALNMFWRTRSLWLAKGSKYFDLSKYFEVDTDTLEIVKEHP